MSGPPSGPTSTGWTPRAHARDACVQQSSHVAREVAWVPRLARSRAELDVVCVLLGNVLGTEAGQWPAHTTERVGAKTTLAHLHRAEALHARRRLAVRETRRVEALRLMSVADLQISHGLGKVRVRHIRKEESRSASLVVARPTHGLAVTSPRSEKRSAQRPRTRPARTGTKTEPQNATT